MLASGEGEYLGMDIEGLNCYHVTLCDVGVSLYSKTHPLFMCYSNGFLCIPVSEFVSFAFSICPFLWYYIWLWLMSHTHKNIGLSLEVNRHRDLWYAYLFMFLDLA